MKVEPIRAGVGGTLPGAAQAVLDALDCQVAVLAASGQVVVANQAWRQLAESDVPSVTHVPAGRNYLQVFERGITGEALHAAAGVHAVLSRHKDRISVEYTCDASSGKVWFKIDATACDIGGSPHTVVVHRSVLPSPDLEATLRHEAQRLVEDELRAQLAKKDEFLAILLHELRNPLAPIANAVELLGRSPDDARTVGEARAIIQRQLRQMTRIVDDLFDASRQRCEDVALRPVRIDVSEPLSIAVEAAQPLIDLRRHSLRIAVTPGRHFVNADTIRLAQVFTNLLINAAKYTKPGGYISVCAQKEGGNITVSVRDNGIGIAPHDQESVFALFSQASANRAGGMGVGLAVARELVERQGGVITVHSDGVGRGSEFTVSLPEASDSAALRG
jgi:signal transduction histidine kinase